MPRARAPHPNRIGSNPVAVKRHDLAVRPGRLANGWAGLFNNPGFAASAHENVRQAPPYRVPGHKRTGGRP